MTRAQLLAAGLIVAAGITVGQVLLNSGATAEAQTRNVGLDLRDVELRNAIVGFLPDGGCSLRADYLHRPAAGELPLQVQSQEYAFGGARCGIARTAAARAAAADLKFTDAGTP